MKTEDIRISLSILMLFIGVEAFILSAPLLLLALLPLVFLAPADNTNIDQ